MFTAIVLAVLAVLSTIAGGWEKLTGRKRKAKLIAIGLIATAAATQIVLINQKAEELKTIVRQEQELADKDVFLGSTVREADEASGGAMQGDTAYIVDDEEPEIFVFKYSAKDAKFDNERLPTKPMPLVDKRPCAQRTWGGPCSDDTPTRLDREMLQDLEGAAAFRDKLYLTTTFSNSKSGKEDPTRWWFLEVNAKGEILRTTKTLRDSIRGIFASGLPINEGKKIEESINEDGKLEVMQVEGLAVDENGMAYFGFRNPLVENKALILRGSVDSLFSETPHLEGFLFNLFNDGESYGIVSLEFDVQNKELLILGNSPLRTKTLPFVVWKIPVSELDPSKVATPEHYRGDTFKLLAPGTRPTKPEVLLLPTPDRVHLFFDAVGTGGQLSFARNEAELKRMR